MDQNILKEIKFYANKIYKPTTDNPFIDLKQILLELRGFEHDKFEILNIVIQNFDQFILSGIGYNFTERFIYISEQISEKNCWKYGYYLTTHDWIRNDKKITDRNYNLEEAILRFYLSEIRFIKLEKLNLNENFKINE